MDRFGVAMLIVVVLGDEGVAAAKGAQGFTKGNVNVQRPGGLRIIDEGLVEGCNPLFTGGIF